MGDEAAHSFTSVSPWASRWNESSFSDHFSSTPCKHPVPLKRMPPSHILSLSSCWWFQSSHFLVTPFLLCSCDFSSQLHGLHIVTAIPAHILDGFTIHTDDPSDTLLLNPLILHSPMTFSSAFPQHILVLLWP